MWVAVGSLDGGEARESLHLLRNHLLDLLRCDGKRRGRRTRGRCQVRIWRTEQVILWAVLSLK